MHYDPRSNQQPHPFEQLQRSVGPRPVAWLSSADSSGRPDLSVYSHWQWLASGSPVIMFSAEQSADGKRAQTVINAENSGWFVWNMATLALQQEVARSLSTPADGIDAFDHAGVAKAPCISASCPRVAQSPAHLECRYLHTQRIAPAQSGGRFVDLVLAEVARVHLKDAPLQLPPALYIQDGALKTFNKSDVTHPVGNAQSTAAET